MGYKSNFFKACYKCENRTVGCHANCENYKQERARQDEMTKKLIEEKELTRTLSSMAGKRNMSIKQSKGLNISRK